MKRRSLAALLVSAGMIAASPAAAATIVIDFTDLFPSSYVTPIVYPSATFTSSTGRLSYFFGRLCTAAASGTCDGILNVSFTDPVNNLTFMTDGDNTANSQVNMEVTTVTTLAGGTNFQSFNDGNSATLDQHDLGSFTDVIQLRVATSDSAGIGYRSFTFDVADVAPIPEPAAWAMMIAGFGLVGGALRRSRASVKLAA